MNLEISICYIDYDNVKVVLNFDSKRSQLGGKFLTKEQIIDILISSTVMVL